MQVETAMIYQLFLRPMTICSEQLYWRSNGRFIIAWGALVPYVLSLIEALVQVSLNITLFFDIAAMSSRWI